MRIGGVIVLLLVLAACTQHPATGGGPGGHETGPTSATSSCSPPDPCRVDPCPPRSICVGDDDGVARCVCLAGHELAGDACLDVDECARGTAACDPLATCTNTDGSYTCTCPPDTVGDGRSCHHPRAVAIAAGPEHACALRDDGAIYCWGAPDGGALGNPGSDGISPARVESDGFFTAIGAGGSPWDPVKPATCAVDRQRRAIICWGAGSRGGEAPAAQADFPEADWKSVGTTLLAPWAIDADGNLVLSMGTTVPHVTAVAASVRSTQDQLLCSIGEKGVVSCSALDLSGNIIGEPPYPYPPQFGALKSVAVGVDRLCAVSVDGVLSCWFPGHWFDVDTATDWQKVVPGCGLRAGGDLWCWEPYDYARVQVLPAGGWVDVVEGGGFTCGLREDGIVRCWGANERGQLGRGPAFAPGSTVTLPGSWQSVDDEGYGHVCALAEDGSAYCWGYGLDGEIGDGATSSRAIPTRVLGDRWSSVVTGGYRSCGIRDGALFCWGLMESWPNNTGNTSVPTPLQVGTDSDWVSVDVGTWNTCGIRAGNSLYCWDDNNSGPVLVPGNWKRAFAVGLATCGETVAGGLFCFSLDEPLRQVKVDAIPDPGFVPLCHLEGTTIVCSGSDLNGQLGDGRGFDPNPGDVALP